MIQLASSQHAGSISYVHVPCRFQQGSVKNSSKYENTHCCCCVAILAQSIWAVRAVKIGQQERERDQACNNQRGCEEHAGMQRHDGRSWRKTAGRQIPLSRDNCGTPQDVGGAHQVPDSMQRPDPGGDGFDLL